MKTEDNFAQGPSQSVKQEPFRPCERNGAGAIMANDLQGLSGRLGVLNLY
jgi:hypothetical protein